MTRRLKHDPDRTYRVAFLRADEAAQLTRDAENEYTKGDADSAQRGDGCWHLDAFCNRGRSSNGGHWLACDLCGYVEETPATPLTGDTAERGRREAAGSLAIKMLFLGILIGLALGFAFWGTR